jgi:hypothetical protein
MKICVVGFHCDSLEALLADEGLANLRRVMDAGLYGAVQNASGWMRFATSQAEDASALTIWTCITQQGKKAILVGLPVSSESIVHHFRVGSLASVEDEWDYYQILDPSYETLASLDEQFGALLESLDSETILLVLALGKTKQEGLFALAAPNCPLAGEFEGAEFIDLAPTLLDLGGYKIPASMKGKSLVAGMEKKTPSANPDDDQLVQDRLSGLGYV